MRGAVCVALWPHQEQCNNKGIHYSIKRITFNGMAMCVAIAALQWNGLWSLCAAFQQENVHRDCDQAGRCDPSVSGHPRLRQRCAGRRRAAERDLAWPVAANETGRIEDRG